MAGIKLHLAAVFVLVVGLLSQTVDEPRAKQSLPEGNQPTAGAAKKPDQDALGDPLPAGALARLGSGRLRHGHAVMTVVFAPDGKALVSAGHDHLVRLWDAATGKPLRTFGQHAERLNPYAPSRWQYAVAFSPDGQLLATAEHAAGWQTGTIRLWETATGKELRALMGHQTGVQALAFSPDGKLLASGGGDATVRLWEVATGREEQQFDAGQGQVRLVAFAGNKLLVTAGEAKTVRVWEAGGGGRFAAKGASLEGVEAAACSADGRLLALGGDKGSLRLWDVTASKEVRRLEGHEAAVISVAFSADGKTLASADKDRTLRFWDAATGKERAAVRGHPSMVRSLALSADGSLAASAGEGDNVVYLWDAATGKAIDRAGGHRSVVTQLRLTADGKTLLSTGWDHTFRRWAPAGKELGSFREEHASSNSSAFSPDGQAVACGGTDGVIRLIEAGSGRELRALPKHDQAVIRVAFAADGATLVSAGADRTLRVWDLASGKERRRFDGPYDQTTRLVVSPDGKAAAWTSDNQAVHLCDLTTGIERQALTVADGVVSVAFSLDGSFLATGTQNGKVSLWDAATGGKVRDLEGHPGWVMGLAFSADGRSLAAGAWMTVVVWEVASGKPRARFTGQDGDLPALAFAPDGRTVASGSGNTTILLWNLTGRPARRALTPPELETVWADFTGEDAERAYRALWTLAAAPEQALPLLRGAVTPAAPVEAKQLAKLIADLDADDFDTRDKASQELEKIGEPAEAALRKALEEQTSAEVRRRAQELLDKLKTSAASTRRLLAQRSLEALEQVGTTEARRVLEELAKSEPDAWLTREAKLAVQRLGKRTR